ncbi:PREDICTED: uncharacterized protein LOC105570443 isoform X2 [Vollenhovia emeryi]|uniref:uncharacterized protein LOC105570443 isoform X2 n=1 Tax=Vollenhovia emeryi TaxID=411798 RepID=UPI0005F3F7CC|nr:PREDICTED: uncharacterized protein LOC105570443 isoform X2 [Vollenhovia emeryi]
MLYMPARCSTESSIQDLRAWLKTELDLDVQSNKKCLDTRTFTRPKKRSALMSFESIFEELPHPTTDIRTQDINVTFIENMEKCLPATIGSNEFVSPILKPSTGAVMAILSDESSAMSGQKSMGAFLNMFKGTNPFINLDESEFSDLLMNVSQPSVLGTSIIASMNESIFIKNGTMSLTNKSMAQNGLDVEDGSNSANINKTFVMRNADNTITLDDMGRTNSLSNTCDESRRLNKGLNAIYDEVPGETSASRSSLDRRETAVLSSTFVTGPNANATFVQSLNKASNDISSLGTTYLCLARGAGKPDSPVSIVDDIRSVALLTREAHAKANALDVSFNVPMCQQSTPINPNMLGTRPKLATKPPYQPQQTVYPTSLRQELLAKIHRNSERKLDSTYNHITSDHSGVRDTRKNIHVAGNKDETDVVPTNKYHTYKKTAFTANQCSSQNEAPVTVQKKFYTFTKKSNPVERTDNVASEARPSMDSTFCKPVISKAQPKRNVPRAWSKLPHFLQKSNPNLVSGSLRGAGGIAVGRMSSIGYIKGSQPNIVQNVAGKSQLPKRMHLYGKMKSGSEQRLLEANVNTNNQFPTGAIAGSTESIESTHSAPELGDRLSACSDSSGPNSLTTRTKNTEQLHELVRMQEESLKQDSAPKPDRQVLENTWVEAEIPRTDLPSPIMKNGVEHCEANRLLLYMNSSMQCSSPINSPAESSHALNNDGSAEGNIAKTKDEIVVGEKTEGPIQVVPKIENKTQLGQPTDWSAGSKPAAVISETPRPASRIPAFKFVRPNSKTT